MTDTTTTQSTKNTAASSTLDVILRMITQNITPAIVGIMCAKCPLLNEATWFEIVVFVLAAIGTAINKLTANSIWDNLVSLILWVRRGFKQVQSATDEPLK